MPILHDCDAIIERVTQIISAPRVHAAIERFLSSAYQARILQSTERMRRKDAFVAVIGSQGSGKSSLINSLIFTKRTLPIGEGITTSLVCFIRDAKGTNERCEVTLKTGQVITLPLERSSLEEFMEESHNPGNRKGVAKITCYTVSDRLVDNSVFVDTPGLGSGLKWQDDATMSFVDDLSLGVFVLRTTPSLTDGEVGFLLDIWPSCPEFLFVQNVWGESPGEVIESQQDTISKLTQIARSRGDRRPISLYAVNIHEGLEGVANHRPESVGSSGLGNLIRVIDDRVSHGGQWLEITKESQQIVTCLQVAIQQAEAEKAGASVRNQPDMERFKEKIELAVSALDGIRVRHQERTTKFRRRCQQIIMSSRNEITSAIGAAHSDFENRLWQHDGQPGIENQYLSKLRNVTEGCLEHFNGSLAGVCHDFIDDSAADIDNLGGVFQSINADAKSLIENVSLTYFLEKIGSVTSTASTIALTALTVMSATTFGTAVAAGTGVTASFAMAAGTVPGVGWAVAFAILGAGYVLKKGAKTKRRNVLLAEFERVKQEVTLAVTGSITAEVERVRKAVTSEVEEHVEGLFAQQEKLLASLRQALLRTEEEKNSLLADILQKTADLEDAIAQIEHLKRDTPEPD
jgi:hypothetical protein